MTRIDPLTGQIVNEPSPGAGGGMSAAYSQPQTVVQPQTQQVNAAPEQQLYSADKYDPNWNKGAGGSDPYSDDTLKYLMLSQMAASYGGGVGSGKGQAIGSTGGMAAGAAIGGAVGGTPGALLGASLGSSAGGGIGSMFGGGGGGESQAEKQQKEVTKNMQHKRYYRSSSLPQARATAASNVIQGKEPTAGMSKVEEGMMTQGSPYQNAAMSNQLLNMRLRRSLMGARLAAITPVLVMMGMAARGGR